MKEILEQRINDLRERISARKEYLSPKELRFMLNSLEVNMTLLKNIKDEERRVRRKQGRN